MTLQRIISCSKKSISGYSKKLSLFLLVTMMLLGNITCVYANDYSTDNDSIVFSDECVYVKSEESFVDDFKTNLEPRMFPIAIISFDVNDKSDIVILFKTGNVLILNKNHKSLNEFMVEDANVVKWIGEDIFVCDTILDHAVLMDINGNIKESYVSEKHMDIYDDLAYLITEERYVGHDCYILSNSRKGRHSILGPDLGNQIGYSYIVKISSNGEKEIVYSVRLQYVLTKLLFWIFVICVVTVCSIKMYYDVCKDEQIEILPILKNLLKEKAS